jgi:putative membrane protein
MRIILHWLINAAALFLLPYVFKWVTVESVQAALVAALVLGLVNALVRPILIVLSLPLTIVTLGLFIFVLNGLLFWAVLGFVDGVYATGFWGAFFGYMVFSLISLAIGAVLLPRRK